MDIRLSGSTELAEVSVEALRVDTERRRTYQTEIKESMRKNMRKKRASFEALEGGEEELNQQFVFRCVDVRG